MARLQFGRVIWDAAQRTTGGDCEARPRLAAPDGGLRFPWRALAPPQDQQPIESSFANIKLRTRVTKGAGSKNATLATAYKLLDAAQERWRRFNGDELVADVLAGVKFNDGINVTDDDNEMTDERVAACCCLIASSTTLTIVLVKRAVPSRARKPWEVPDQRFIYLPRLRLRQQ